MYPHTRMRRLRQAPWIRSLVAENHLKASDLIMPFFVCEGHKVVDPIVSMPGVARFSIDQLMPQVERSRDLGIKMIALFPVIDRSHKDAHGSMALDKNNIICRAIQALKARIPDIGIMADVALDPYTSHCHDGVLGCDGDVDNDETNCMLVQQALLLAESGCDAVAPSDMMDGRIGLIRRELERHGFFHTMIISYAAKYASSFYGPFREAVKSVRDCGYLDKKTYQMDYRNSAEALKEVLLDEQEGADMLIIKPGMPFLDVIHCVTQHSTLPVLAYQVSGEYAMLKHAASQGCFNYDDAMVEALTAFKRAGARGIISYAAMDVASRL